MPVADRGRPMHAPSPASPAPLAPGPPGSTIAGLTNMVNTLRGLEGSLDPQLLASNFHTCFRNLILCCPEKEALPLIRALVEEGRVDLNSRMLIDGPTSADKEGRGGGGAATTASALRKEVVSGKRQPTSSTDAALMESLQRADARTALIATQGMRADPVGTAASSGAALILMYLLSKGCSPHTLDSSGYTPLHHAVVGGHVDAIRVLVRAGADVNHIDGDGLTALHTATTAHMPDVVALLLKAGADVNIGEEGTGLTPLHTAADGACLFTLLQARVWREAGRKERVLPPMCRIPVDGGSGSADEPTGGGKKGKRGGGDGGATQPAVAWREVPSDPSYDAHFAPALEKRSVRGWSPLFTAAYSAKLACVKVLLEAGANPAALNDLGETPMHAACYSGNVACIEMVAKAGGPLNALSHSRRSPFHVAAMLEQPMAAACAVYLAGGRAICPASSGCKKCRIVFKRVQQLVDAGPGAVAAVMEETAMARTLPLTTGRSITLPDSKILGKGASRGFELTMKEMEVGGVGVLSIVVGPPKTAGGAGAKASGCKPASSTTTGTKEPDTPLITALATGRGKRRGGGAKPVTHPTPHPTPTPALAEVTAAPATVPTTSPVPAIAPAPAPPVATPPTLGEGLVVVVAEDEDDDEGAEGNSAVGSGCGDGSRDCGDHGDGSGGGEGEDEGEGEDDDDEVDWAAMEATMTAAIAGMAL